MALTYGFVTGTLVYLRGDLDSDGFPDEVGATNIKVTFTYSTPKYPIDDPSMIVNHEPVVAGVMADGRITDDLDSAGLVKPTATPDLRLVTGTWTVTTSNNFYPPFDIVVTEAHTSANPLDIADAISYEPPAGVTVQTVELPSGAADGQVLGWEGGLAWVTGGAGGGVTDHGALTGLSDDDHPQYFNQTRGDARYYTKTQVDTALGGKADDSHNHTSGDITNLTEAVQDIVGGFVVAGTNVTVTYDDVANTFTINATASGGGETDPEVVRDVIGGALVAGSGIQITVNDAGDTITIASTAVLPTRTVSAGTGLTGGGDLSADRTFAVNFGTTAGTVSEGNHDHDGVYATASHGHTATDISDSTTTGRSVLTAVDAESARTAIGAMNATDWGILPTIYIDSGTGVWPARSTPSGYTGSVIWDSVEYADATAPSGAIAGDRWVQQGTVVASPVAYVDGATGETYGTSSFTVPVPAAAESGNLAVLFVDSMNNTVTNTVSGWTLLGQARNTENITTDVFYRTLDGTETEATVATDNSAIRIQGTMVVYSNVTGTPTIATATMGGSTNVTLPTLAAAGPGFAVAHVAERGNPVGTDWTTPSPYTERYDVRTAMGASVNVSGATGDASVSAAATIGGETFTSDVSLGHQTAIIVYLPGA